MIQKQKKIWIVVTLLVLLTGGVLLLPTLLSTAPLNKIVFNSLNRQVAPAELSIEKMSLGWFSEQKADSVHYQNEEAGVQAHIDSVVIEKSLLGMLFSRTGLGLIRLESPRMVVPLKTISDFESERSDDTDKDDEKEPHEGELDRDIAKSLGQILSAWGSASFNGGQVFGVTKDDEEVLLLDQVQLETAVQKESSQATIKLSAKSGRDDGYLLGDIAITIPEDGIFNKSSFVGQGKLTLTDWNLDELLPLAALFSDEVPFGRGRINGEWQMENPSQDQLQLTGTIKAKNIALYGGFLEKDQPQISQLICDIDALRKEGQWSVRQVNFTSPLGNGSASGFRDKSTGERHLKIDTRINLAPTLAQFPNSLNIRDDLNITNGSIQVAGNITQADENTLFKGRLRLTRLEGQQGKRKFVWKKPLTVTGKGNYRVNQWKVDEAKVSSTFINGEGYANPVQVKGRLTVDSAKTVKQAGQFFKLPPIALKGLIETEFRANKKGAVWDLDIKATSDALGISSQKKALLAAAPFDLQATSQYQIESGNYLLTTPQLKIKSGLGRGLFQSDQMVLRPDGKMLKMLNASASGNVNIGKLGAVYSAIAATQPEWAFSGMTRYEVAFNFEKEELRIQDISLTAAPFTFFNDRHRFSDQKVTLNSAGVIDVVKRSASFIPVNISATAGKATFESFKLGNWRKPLEELAAKGVANFDLARFASFYKGNNGQQATLAGHGEAMLETVWQKGALTKLGVKSIVAPFKWRFNDDIKIDEPKVVVDLEVGPGQKVTSAIKRLLVKSNLISLNGTGSFDSTAKKRLFQLRGNLGANLNKLSFLFSGLLGRPVILSGKKESPFSIAIDRKNDTQKEWLQSLVLKVQLPANRITTMGLSLDQLTLPVTIKKGQAAFNMKAAVNGGKMAMAPVVPLTQDPVMTVGKGTVLKNVRMTQSMIDGILTKLHPIFVGATVGQGAVDLYLNKLIWPLTDNTQAPQVCGGQLSFNRVSLKSTGLLDEILSLLKADRRNLVIETEAMNFYCREGWVVTSPLTLKANDTTIVLEGSMGFDQSLDFMARTPITERMVSDKIFPYVADSMIAIPISGTTTNPQINTEQFFAELENLVKEAGVKAIQDEAEDYVKEKTEGLLKKIFK